ncbi:MAG: hypothetical protein NT154_17455, partial [Verrucomicrobia bacterium]|nr:hypothetical protein [Verrucomicrobiota bacterium]
PGETTFIRGAAPVRSGVRATPSMVMLGVCPAPVLGACTITTLYTARYGAPAVGSRIFVATYQMADGWEGLPTIFTGVVPASS